jgi:hypothetical protein
MTQKQLDLLGLRNYQIYCTRTYGLSDLLRISIYQIYCTWTYELADLIGLTNYYGRSTRIQELLYLEGLMSYADLLGSQAFRISHWNLRTLITSKKDRTFLYLEAYFLQLYLRSLTFQSFRSQGIDSLSITKTSRTS